jgi:hypothetical protein
MKLSLAKFVSKIIFIAKVRLSLLNVKVELCLF